MKKIKGDGMKKFYVIFVLCVTMVSHFFVVNAAREMRGMILENTGSHIKVRAPKKEAFAGGCYGIWLKLKPGSRYSADDIMIRGLFHTEGTDRYMQKAEIPLSSLKGKVIRCDGGTVTGDDLYYLIASVKDADTGLDRRIGTDNLEDSVATERECKEHGTDILNLKTKASAQDYLLLGAAGVAGLGLAGGLAYAGYKGYRYLTANADERLEREIEKINKSNSGGGRDKSFAIAQQFSRYQAEVRNEANAQLGKIQESNMLPQQKVEAMEKIEAEVEKKIREAQDLQESILTQQGPRSESWGPRREYMLEMQETGKVAPKAPERPLAVNELRKMTEDERADYNNKLNAERQGNSLIRYYNGLRTPEGQTVRWERNGFYGGEGTLNIPPVNGQETNTGDENQGN